MSTIPTHRRIEYARGYLELGMSKEAAAELNTIASSDQNSIAVLRVYVDLFMDTKQWTKVIAAAEPVCKSTPKDEGAWIAWAYALRELQQTKEAQDVLLRAEPLHEKTCDVLHYNLACYACLLGNLKEARRRLTKAIKMDKQWQESALSDTDLETMWSEIREMK